MSTIKSAYLNWRQCQCRLSLFDLHLTVCLASSKGVLAQHANSIKQHRPCELQLHYLPEGVALRLF